LWHFLHRAIVFQFLIRQKEARTSKTTLGNSDFLFIYFY